MSIQDTRRANLRVWAQKHGIPSKEKSYFSQILSGTSPIGERAARRLERDYRMGEGFLDAENPTIAEAASQPAPEPQATNWPFPSIPEDQVRKLSPAQISALEGAIALASGQLKLGLAVAPACHEDHDEASNDNEYAFIDRIDAKLSAGRGKIIYHAERRSRLSFRRDWLRSQGITDPKRAVLTELEGRSMEKTIPDGSTILIDLSRTEIINGKVYAIFHDGEFYVKRLFARGVIVTANSDTDDQATYPPFILTKESDTIIGRVFWCGFDV